MCPDYPIGVAYYYLSSLHIEVRREPLAHFVPLRVEQPDVQYSAVRAVAFRFFAVTDFRTTTTAA